MLVTAGPMDMPVSELFSAGLPHFDHFSFEVQGNARKGGVGVNMDDIVADCGDDNRDGSMIGLGSESHARLDFVVTELLSGDLCDE